MTSTAGRSATRSDELDEVSLAYAISIHKSQGSEYPAVVIPVAMQHYLLLERNLLYTGVTRGKRLVILIGQPQALGMAVRNQRSGRRITKLAERLQSASPLNRRTTYERRHRTHHSLTAPRGSRVPGHSQPSTLPGYPFLSVLPFVPDEQHCPIFLISGLAEHTRNLAADTRASLLLLEPGQNDVQSGSRLTVSARSCRSSHTRR